MTSTDWIGFIGVSILLLAYLLNLSQHLSTNGITYILLNFIGATLACLASIMLHYWPFILLEGAWMAVSLFSIINYFKKK